MTTPLIEVECDGRVASWHPETGFVGDRDLVADAEEAAAGNYVVEWGSLAPQKASTETMLGALTALMYHRPGHTRVTAWPDALRDWWETNHDPCGAHID